MLPVSKPRQLFLRKLQSYRNAKSFIMQAAYTHAHAISRYINKHHIFSAATMRLERSRAFSKVIIFIEDPVITIFMSWLPFSFPNNVCAFIYQRPSKIAMVQQHKRSRFIATVHYFVMNFY